MNGGMIPYLVAVNAHEMESGIDALESAGFAVARVTQVTEVASLFEDDPPSCMIYSAQGDFEAMLPEVTRLKHDNMFGHLPLILVLQKHHLPSINWQSLKADDYLLAPATDADLIARVRLCLARAQRDINANPLTGLPGNLTLMRDAEERLAVGAPFALAYVDIDNFKPFNDKYGFARGDEVLRMTARVLVNAVRACDDPDAYVGHVGGDDFIFMASSHVIEQICRNVIDNFDMVVPNFYDDDDRERGQIISTDRKGNVQSYPLMGCSIAVVDTSIANIGHIADLSARAAEVKKYAKTLTGSTYVIDRRR